MRAKISRRRTPPNFQTRSKARIVCLLLAATIGGMADGFDRWTPRNPLPQSRDIKALGSNDGTLVAVGSSGSILRSTDDIHWGSADSGSPDGLRDVSWGLGNFVAVGEKGRVLTSEDGQYWKSAGTNLGADLNSILFDGQRFIAAGAQGLAYISPDARQWSEEKLPVDSAVRGLASAGGIWVAVCDGGQILARAPEAGAVWEIRLNAPGTGWAAVTTGNSRIVAVGSRGMAAVSTNALEWQTVFTGFYTDLESIDFHEGRFVAVGDDGAILASQNGFEWENHTPVDVDARLAAIDLGRDRFVVFGEFHGALMSSSGGSWTNSGPLGFSAQLSSVAFGAGTFAAVGGGGSAAISRDGLVWRQTSAGVPETLRGITWGNGLFVAVGDAGRILHARDGLNWERVETNLKASFSEAFYDGSRFIVVGGEFSSAQDHSIIAVSTNATEWTIAHRRPGPWLNSIARSDSRYVAVGNEGRVLLSADLIAWEEQVSGTAMDLLGIAHSGGVFAAIGGKYFDSSSPILTSTNGVQWTVRRPFNDNGALAAIVVANGQFIAAGGGTIGRGHFNRSFTSIVTSSDGINWKARNAGLAADWLAGLVYAQGTALAVGFNGLILQSAPDAASSARTDSRGGGFK